MHLFHISNHQIQTMNTTDENIRMISAEEVKQIKLLFYEGL